ncbi:MAG: terminase large subunit [Methanobrevibacter sp.]|nr:terminase large subunit [Methanobrevibacter sp.]
MKEYYQYIEDVKSGKIRASKYIKQQIERIENFSAREDLYFDEKEVQECFDFIACMKEWSGKAAGKSAALLPYQKFIIGSILGVKYKEDGTRLCRECLVFMARKNAKTSLMAKFAAYMMICGGEANPFIGCVATSTQNARILFEAACKYLKTIDPQMKSVKVYRNYIKFPANDGEFHVFSSEADTLEGFNFFIGFCDEIHTYKDNKLLSVIRASMPARKSPILMSITTAGSLKDGYPCYEMYKMSIEILAGVKDDDSFFPYLFCMDPDDDWKDENNWVKANPSLDVIVSRDFLRQQVQLAENDTSQLSLIKTKNFNIWTSTMDTWIPGEKVAKVMKKVNLEDLKGNVAYIGIDLASVSDLTALSIMIPFEGKYYFKSWGWVPRETFVNSPNHELYERFSLEGDLIVSEGNVADYSLIVNKIVELGEMFSIQGVYYDPYNSSQLAIECTNLGFNMQQCRQGLLSFSNPTKEFERLVLSEQAVIDRSMLFLYCINNCFLKCDANFNCKPDKTSPNNKIDLVISAIEALSGYLSNPIDNNLEIFVL